MAEDHNQTLDATSSLPEQATNGGEEDLPMPDAQIPKNESDSASDSESDSDDDDEAQLHLLIQSLEADLTTNPYNYDSHVQYIRALRKQGELEKLRQARESMSLLFPLTPDMWQEWAKDETSLSSGPEAYSAVEKLYERGVSDYLSIALWCDYINFVKEYDPAVRECTPSGISKARNLFERAITASGLHVAEGNRIWEMYRDFEQAVLITLQETDKELREKQVQRIRNLFHRQLSIPLANVKSTLLIYKAWETKQGTIDVNSSDLEGIAPHVVAAYHKALELLNARMHLEEQITRKDLADSEKLQQYMTYLKFEQSSGDPARVQILFERAMTEFPVSSDLWLDYTRYLDKIFKASKIVRDVYYRATRNCPWVGGLWVRYLLCLERGRASEEEISKVFEKSLQSSFSSYEEYLDIYLTRVDGLRRRMSGAGKEEAALDYAVIRYTFQRAVDYVSAYLKDTESLLRMYSYWAQLESKLGKDLAAARSVWESFLKISGSMMEAWQGYITMEIGMGHIKEARSLYKRCYSKRFSGTGSEDICHAWVRFEREYGLLEDYDLALQKVAPRLEELQLFRLQQESKTTVPPPTGKREVPLEKNAREKRKLSSSSTDDQSPAKRRKDTTQNLKTNNKLNKSQAMESTEVGEKESVSAQNSMIDKTNEKETGKRSHEKSTFYNDQCTAFVSNLSLKATVDDLRNFFSDVGGVGAIRILKDKFTNKSRGLAYVDFSDDAHLVAAVAKNKQKLLEKRVSIAKSDPKRKNKEAVSHNTKGEHEDSSKDRHTQSGGQRNRDERVQLKGKNTFAVPRTVKALGWTAPSKSTSEKVEEGGDEEPKSNDEFRKMFLKA